MNEPIPPSSYCAVAPGHPVHGSYHDREYGFPLTDDDLLFERLLLEINQAGLAHHHPLSRPEWVRLFKKTFRFTGGEITGEFLMSIGYLPGAHVPGCPVFETIREAAPPWMDARGGAAS